MLALRAAPAHLGRELEPLREVVVLGVVEQRRAVAQGGFRWKRRFFLATTPGIIVLWKSSSRRGRSWTINLKGADIREFIDQIAAITGQTFVVDGGMLAIMPNTGDFREKRAEQWGQGYVPGL